MQWFNQTTTTPTGTAPIPEIKRVNIGPLETVLSNLANMFFTIAIPITLLFIVLYIVLWTTAKDEVKQGKQQKRLILAGVGLFLLLFINQIIGIGYDFFGQLLKF